MTILEKTFLWVLYSSLTASVITLLVLFIKKLFNNKLSPRLHHALWFLVLIRLLLPFVPESNLSLFNLFINNHKSLTISNPLEPIYLNEEQTDDNTSELDDTKQNKVNQNIYFKENPSKHKNQPLSSGKESNMLQQIIKVCSYIWLIGFLSTCTCILLILLRFKKKAVFFKKSNLPRAINALNICKENLNIDRNIPIYYGNTFKTPFIYGLLNPKIYLPQNILDTIDDNQLLHICLHELAHYKRRDLFYNLLGITAIIIHWFNPIVWIAMKKMKTDRELACDNYVLEILGENESIPYGMTIIKLSQIILDKYSKKTLFTHFYENKNQIERRITMIKMFKKGSYRASIVAVALLVVLGTTTLTNAKGLEGKINTEKVSPQSIIENEDKEFTLDNPSKSFNNLDRAKDFVDFKFKVPDFIPSGYELYDIDLDKDDTLRIDFWTNIQYKEHHFNFIVSKKDIIQEMKEITKDKESSANIYRIKSNSTIKEEPMHIGNIKGNSIAIDWKNNNSSIKNLHTISTTDKYFVWKDNDIWYSIQYYDSGVLFDSSSYVNEISKDNIQKIISSIKYPDDTKNVKYVSKAFKNSLYIYDNKDLKESEKILDFKPKFPLSLPEGFYPTYSMVSDFAYSEGSNHSEQSICMETRFSLKDAEPFTGKIDFSQTKNRFFYDILAEKGYFETKDRSTKEMKKIEVDELMINNIKVLTYKDELDTYIGKVKYTSYTWMENGVVYEAEFTSDIKNKEEIVKALMMFPTKL
ncbi:M56 family metallopeptidase [Tissierella sp. MSJ-40]|uniref:M56 family metallopeptidase n=1 Tax=Tissierella simiarum TaxID=2841534 RepID=A0ABS6E5J0_9FIRM|nr:M56 family metallopeptidase [Tissierella simiarum]MBU5438101.1 M56 family metallopeptidase [Tissierella simiarum]